MFDPFSLAIIAASAFLKYQADEEAAERREAFRRNMEAYQRTKAAESERATETLLKKQTPEARGTELKDITADREQSLRDTVGAAQAFDAPPIAGKLSSDYQSTQEANATRVAERTRRAIEQLATMGAPEEQQLRHGLRFGRAASAVDAANDAIQNVGAGYLSDIEDVRPDPTLSLLGSVGMAVGGRAVGGSGAFGDDSTIDWTGPGDPSPADIEDAAMAGKTLRRPVSALSRIQRGLDRSFGLWGRTA